MTDLSMQGMMREIDDIDMQIIQLLTERFMRSPEIGRLKQKSGLATFDPARVDAQTEAFISRCIESKLDGEMGASLFRQLWQRS